MYTQRSTNDSLLDGFNSTFANATFQLAGNDFKDPILVSAIAVNGVCVVVFAILAIAAHWIKDKKVRGRRAFGVLAGLLGAMFLSFVDATGVGIANELASNISFVAVVLGLVRNTINNATDTSLLFVVYSVISNRLPRVGVDNERNITLRQVNLGFASITAVLGLADAILGDYANAIANIESDDSDVADDPNAVKWVKLYGKVHLAYLSVYCAVALEILACAVFIFKRSKMRDTTSRIAKYLMMLVTPFLVIRSLAALALGVYYVYLGRAEQSYTGLINAATLGITAAVLYTGMLLIGFQKDWPLQDSVVSYLPEQLGSSGSASTAQGDTGQPKAPRVSAMRIR